MQISNNCSWKFLELLVYKLWAAVMPIMENIKMFKEQESRTDKLLSKEFSPTPTTQTKIVFKNFG